jgi:hypothetical protein
VGKFSAGGVVTEVVGNITGNPVIWHKENAAKIGIGFCWPDFLRVWAYSRIGLRESLAIPWVNFLLRGFCRPR